MLLIESLICDERHDRLLRLRPALQLSTNLALILLLLHILRGQLYSAPSQPRVNKSTFLDRSSQLTLIFPGCLF